MKRSLEQTERQVESKDRKCRVDRVFETYEG